MIDREKVIKGLEHCIAEGKDCRGCIYYEQMINEKESCACRADALALLKEQQKNIQYWSDKYDEMGRLYMKIRDEQPQIVRCKDCKYHDEDKDINFCDCGNRQDDWFCADGERVVRNEQPGTGDK